uniref:Uncharacterized protein n=1 Tax=Monomastix sp. (strain OKE-1) TaxID=141716 RepID=U5YEP6_MONSK|nr:hypothetical protein [Monomastix sp. OKE-1]AGZ90182.1 hypothetical protein [Monomastix sp. OKE-1]
MNVLTPRCSVLFELKTHESLGAARGPFLRCGCVRHPILCAAAGRALLSSRPLYAAGPLACSPSLGEAPHLE